jgi:hypothetical protein
LASIDACPSAVARALVVQAQTCEDDMTTITINSSSVGFTVAQNGVMSKLTFTAAGRGVGGASFGEVLMLVDDANLGATGFDTVGKVLFYSDMLCQASGAAFGVCFEDQSIAFGNLTVQSCPSNATFEIEATGALATPIKIVPSASAAVQAESERLLALRNDHARRVAADRNAIPKGSLELTPHAEPAGEPVPPDPHLVAADELGARLFEEERQARAVAKGPTIVGKSLMQIQDEWRVAAMQARRGAG